LTKFDGFESQVRDWFRRLEAERPKHARSTRSGVPTPERVVGAETGRRATRSRATGKVYTADWSALPEEALLGRETLHVVKRAIEELPVAPRRVIAMRDIAGLGADEVCDALGLSAGNQRVLLHRARSRVRAALEVHLDG
jgi:RNA polymerase sigma-70 factor (ECF subfamily)